MGDRSVPDPATQRGAGHRVFIDFDNTITIGDMLDGVIERFAGDGSWRTFEEDWAAGRIGTRACLEGQVLTLRAEWSELRAHLDGIELDPGFAILRDQLRREQVELMILSDNFDLFVSHLLQRHGLDDVPFRSNHVERTGNRFLPSFPHANPECPGCAHCKKTHFLPPHHDARRVIYIGDGRSDVCPSLHADIVFAKDSLLTHLQKKGIACIPYRNLTEVSQRLETILHDNVQ